MALLNYTTTVEASKTAAEIQEMLRKHDAQAVIIEYGPARQISGLSFEIAVGTERIVSFRLPVQAESVYKILTKQWKQRIWDQQLQAAREAKTRAQAERVAWRILKDWIEAQLALIDVGMVSLDQVFMPYAITGNGQTLYERIKGSNFLMLQQGRGGD